MQIIYWASTLLLSLFLLWSAFTYFFNETTIIGIRELGIRDYLRIQFAVFKIISVIILILPSIPPSIKQWAYSFIFFFLITAIVAHSVHGDPIFLSIINLFSICLLVISNIYLHKLNN